MAHYSHHINIITWDDHNAGLATHYFGWRILQLSLGATGIIIIFTVVCFFPETYHPGKRGVDSVDPASLPKWRPVLLNPLEPLWMLRSPILLSVVSRFFCVAEVYPFDR